MEAIKTNLNIWILLFEILPTSSDCASGPNTRNKTINLTTGCFPDLRPSCLVVNLQIHTNNINETIQEK